MGSAKGRGLSLVRLWERLRQQTLPGDKRQPERRGGIGLWPYSFAKLRDRADLRCNRQARVFSRNPLGPDEVLRNVPPKLFPHDISIDDGQYHSALQDFTVHIGYQALNGPVAISPFAAAVIPSHSYTTFAHTAVGKHLHEYLLGFSIGGRLDRLVPGSYVEATYSYAFVERLMGIHHDRSNVFLELGYFVTPSLSLRGIATGLYTHGGFAFKSPQETPLDLFPIHDRIGHDEGLDVGAGISYLLTGSTEVYASYLKQVEGRGGHKIANALSFGVSWSFSPQQLGRRLFASRSSGSAGE